MNGSKKLALNIFRSFLSHDDTKNIVMKMIQNSHKKIEVSNKISPYFKSVDRDNNDHPAIFISGRFRSGSTLLWNIFRNIDGCTSYYEPFNERKWFDKSARGEGVDGTHLGVGDYWSEYDGMESLAEFYSEEWIHDNFLMDEKSINVNMGKYIDYLILNSNGIPVLQFNRVDLRLQWLKANYPNSKTIHIFRHPREQWLSFLTDKTLMNKDDVVNTYVDNFYLDVWCKDLKFQFPFLSKENTPHPYQRFYYLWKLSYLYGAKYSDVSFSFEELVEQPKIVLEQLFEKINLICPNLKEIIKLIKKPRLDKWTEYADDEWFSSMEIECEQKLQIYLLNES